MQERDNLKFKQSLNFEMLQLQLLQLTKARKILHGHEAVKTLFLELWKLCLKTQEIHALA